MFLRPASTFSGPGSEKHRWAAWLRQPLQSLQSMGRRWPISPRLGFAGDLSLWPAWAMCHMVALTEPEYGVRPADCRMGGPPRHHLPSCLLCGEQKGFPYENVFQQTGRRGWRGAEGSGCDVGERPTLPGAAQTVCSRPLHILLRA